MLFGRPPLERPAGRGRARVGPAPLCCRASPPHAERSHLRASRFGDLTFPPEASAEPACCKLQQPSAAVRTLLRRLQYSAAPHSQSAPSAPRGGPTWRPSAGPRSRSPAARPRWRGNGGAAPPSPHGLWRSQSGVQWRRGQPEPLDRPRAARVPAPPPASRRPRPAAAPYGRRPRGRPERLRPRLGPPRRARGPVRGPCAAAFRRGGPWPRGRPAAPPARGRPRRGRSRPRGGGRRRLGEPATPSPPSKPCTAHRLPWHGQQRQRRAQPSARRGPRPPGRSRAAQAAPRGPPGRPSRPRGGWNCRSPCAPRCRRGRRASGR
mmetsp:Transcript_144491/g.463003  ORF Transcript_144491/g.463003 Transcript_144491/m.463003 type:complete len:321 (-) Transcript_144491:1479-2441(-)